MNDSIQMGSLWHPVDPRGRRDLPVRVVSVDNKGGAHVINTAGKRTVLPEATLRREYGYEDSVEEHAEFEKALAEALPVEVGQVWLPQGEYSFLPPKRILEVCSGYVHWESTDYSTSSWSACESLRHHYVLADGEPPAVGQIWAAKRPPWFYVAITRVWDEEGETAVAINRSRYRERPDEELLVSRLHMSFEYVGNLLRGV